MIFEKKKIEDIKVEFERRKIAHNQVLEKQKITLIIILKKECYIFESKQKMHPNWHYW